MTRTERVTIAAPLCVLIALVCLTWFPWYIDVLIGFAAWGAYVAWQYRPQPRDARGRWFSRLPWLTIVSCVAITSFAACKPEPINTPPDPPPPSAKPKIEQASDAALRLATDQVENVVKPAERGAQRITEATATAPLTPPQRQQVTEGVKDVHAAAENANAIATKIKLEVAGPLITAGQQAGAVDDAAAKLAKQVEALQSELTTAQQAVEQARREARESFTAKLTTWAAISAALAVPCLILAGWQVFRGSIKGAIALGVIAACLIGGGVALWTIATFWLWIVAGVCAVGAGLVGWLVWTAVDRDRRGVALQAVVRGVEESEPVSGPVKARISTAAGKNEPLVKAVVREFKSTGLLAGVGT